MTRAVVHVVGARPNFMKMGPVHAALEGRGLDQQVVHTGQHYDPGMSDVFFRQLGLPEPTKNLDVRSGTHASQTARILVGLESIVRPDSVSAVIVYGDVNSTLAAAILCSKSGMPLVHVEAGLRSFDRSMPEEINRVITDSVSDLLLVTSPEALVNLGREGVSADRCKLVGNPMIDTLLANRSKFNARAVAGDLGVAGAYGLATLHRPANVDDPVVARKIVEALKQVADRIPLLVPLHPRGRDRLAELGMVTGGGIHVVDPLGYLEFLSLASGASIVITDSGGVQEETTILNVPCLTVRPNTERPITITHGTNLLIRPDDLLTESQNVLNGTAIFPSQRPPMWDGRAGPRIANEIVALLDGR